MTFNINDQAYIPINVLKNVDHHFCFIFWCRSDKQRILLLIKYKSQKQTLI